MFKKFQSKEGNWFIVNKAITPNNSRQTEYGKLCKFTNTVSLPSTVFIDGAVSYQDSELKGNGLYSLSKRLALPTTEVRKHCLYNANVKALVFKGNMTWQSAKFAVQALMLGKVIFIGNQSYYLGEANPILLPHMLEVSKAEWTITADGQYSPVFLKKFAAKNNIVYYSIDNIKEQIKSSGMLSQIAHNAAEDAGTPEDYVDMSIYYDLQEARYECICDSYDRLTKLISKQLGDYTLLNILGSDYIQPKNIFKLGKISKLDKPTVTGEVLTYTDYVKPTVIMPKNDYTSGSFKSYDNGIIDYNGVSAKNNNYYKRIKQQNDYVYNNAQSDAETADNWFKENAPELLLDGFICIKCGKYHHADDTTDTIKICPVCLDELTLLELLNLIPDSSRAKTKALVKKAKAKGIAEEVILYRLKLYFSPNYNTKLADWLVY